MREKESEKLINKWIVVKIKKWDVGQVVKL